MSWRTEHTTAAGLLLAFALPALIIAAAYHAAGDLAASRSWVSHSQEMLLKIDGAQLDLAAAGNLARSYQLHPSEETLGQYQAAKARIGQDMANLRTGLRDNPTQAAPAKALGEAIGARLGFMDQELRATAAGRTPTGGTSRTGGTAAGAARADAGLRLAQAVQTRAAAMTEEENRLLSQRRQRTLEFSRQWNKYFWGACLVSLLVILFCFVLLVREVRIRRRTQESLAFSHRQLEESWDRYHSLIANVPAAVWTMRRNGETEFISPRIQNLTGHSPAEVVTGGARFWPERIHEQDRAAVEAGFQALFAGTEPLAAEYRLRHRNGEWMWMQAQGRHVYRKDGAELADGVFIDITERKQSAARELRQREIEINNREAERSNRFKSEFLASVSHELRTPMSAILGFSDLMLQGIGGTLNPEQTGFVEHIERGGKHLLALINDILDLTKLEAGQLQIAPETLPLAAPTAEALEMMDGVAETQGVRLSSQLAAGLTVWADPLRVRQIFFNLISNAVKFTPAGGEVRVTAEVAQGRGGGMAMIRVIDTGVGIAEEHLELIFERFRQVGATTRGIKEGTGLGLAITKNLVERQGGEIGVESAPGAGSCFWFTLPRGDAARAQGEAS